MEDAQQERGRYPACILFLFGYPLPFACFLLFGILEEKKA